MSISEVAEHLGVGQRQAYQMIKQGKIPAAVIAGKLRVPREAWDAWLRTQTQRAAANIVGK